MPFTAEAIIPQPIEKIPVHAGRSTVITSIAVLLIAGLQYAKPSDAQQPPARYEQKSAAAAHWLVAVKSGNPQNWANTLQALSGSTSVSPAVVTELAALLNDSSAAVRARAAMALGALGAAAHTALPQLLRAMRDPDSIARAEVIFAVGALGARTEPVLRGLYIASTVDGPGLARRAALLALNRLGRRPPITVSTDFAEELQAALKAPQVNVRTVALRTAMRANVPWAAEAFISMLSDADPYIRVDAAFAVAGTDDSTRAAAAIKRLEHDSVEWVRGAIPGLLARLRSPAESSGAECHHRTVAGTGQATVALSVAHSSSSLRDDGRGRYESGAGGVRAATGVSFNFFLPNAPLNPGTGSKPRSEYSDTATRAMVIDLSEPLASPSNRAGTLVRDDAARIHTFYLFDARRVIWNLRDIPVGAAVKSSRTQINFFLNGRYHILQFGSWSLGDCGEEYAPQTKLGGQGTTSVNIHRVGSHEYRIWTPPGSTGRLWEVSEQSHAVDLGLYRFGFDIRISQL
jgi:hypothetical protein